MRILVNKIVRKTLEETHASDQRPKDNIKIGIGLRLTAEGIHQNQVEFLQQHNQSDAQFNTTTAKPFKDYLAGIWNNWLKDKIGFSFFSLQTQGNFGCYALANVLSKAIREPLYQLLVPTLEIDKSKNYDIPPNRLVLSKNQRTLIDVLECLDNARNSKSAELKHTHPVKDQDELLNEEEQNWVINHSEESRAYYQAIRDNASEEIKATARDNLVQYFTPLARDSEEDEIFLQKLYPNRDDLVTAIKELNPENRNSVLKAFKLETLKKMVLNNRDLDVSIEDKSLYKPNDPGYNAALMTILRCIYLKELEKRGPEFKWKVQNSLPDRFAKAQSKKIKMIAGTHYYDAMIEGTPFDQLETKVEQAIKDDKEIDENDKAFVLSATKQGTHLKFREQVINLRNPEYLKTLSEENKSENRAESQSSWRSWIGLG